jgi:hypothetical protein
VFKGSVGVVYGDPTDIGSNSSVYLVAAVGTVEIDRNEFYLSGGLSVAAARTGLDPNGAPIYTGYLAQATGSIDLNWGARLYTAQVHATFLSGVFVVDGGFRFSDQPGNQSLLIYASAYVEVPSFIPVLGGDTLAGLHFAFYYDHGVAGTVGFAAAWLDVDVIRQFNVGIYYDIQTEKFSLLGGQGVAAVEACVNNPSACPTVSGSTTYSMGFNVPAAATSATLSVTFPPSTGKLTLYVTPPGPNSVPIQQCDFDPNTNHLELIKDTRLASSTQYQVQIVGDPINSDYLLPNGMYNLSLVSTVPLDSSKFIWSSRLCNAIRKMNYMYG